MPVLVVGGRHSQATASLIDDLAGPADLVLANGLTSHHVEAQQRPRATLREISELTVELEPGSCACDIRWDLIREVEWALNATRPPARIIIELAHDSDVVTVAQSLLGDARVRAGAELERVVVVAHPDDLTTTPGWMDELRRRRERSAWALADEIVVDGDTSRDRREGATGFRNLGLRARVTTAPGLATRLLAEPQVQHSFAAIGQRLDHPACDRARTGRSDSEPLEFTIQTDGELDADGVDEWIGDLIEEMAEDLVLIEGRLEVAGDRLPWLVRGYRGTIEVASDAGVRRRHHSRARLVGFGLDRIRVAASLDRCTAR